MTNIIWVQRSSNYLYENKCQKPSKKVAWLGGLWENLPPTA